MSEAALQPRESCWTPASGCIHPPTPHPTPPILQRSSHRFSFTMPNFARADTRFVDLACKRISERQQLVLGVCHGFRMMRGAANRLIVPLRNFHLAFLLCIHFVAAALSEANFVCSVKVQWGRCSGENRSDGPSGHLFCFIVSTQNPLF